jgi:hypothetical protein
MNPDHIISGWIAQLRRDSRGAAARAGTGDRAGSVAPPRPSGTVTQPAAPAPSRTHRLSLVVRPRSGLVPRELPQPCLGFGA